MVSSGRQPQTSLNPIWSLRQFSMLLGWSIWLLFLKDKKTVFAEVPSWKQAEPFNPKLTLNGQWALNPTPYIKRACWPLLAALARRLHAGTQRGTQPGSTLPWMRKILHDMNTLNNSYPGYAVLICSLLKSCRIFRIHCIPY